MSLRFALAVLLMLASFAGLVELGRFDWNLHVDQRHALGRVKPPEYFDDSVEQPGWQASPPPSRSA
jgi:hypothetical protein